MRRTLGLTAIAVVVGLAAGCGPKRTDDDLGPVDDTLSFADRVNWPGTDRASGRVIPLIGGFGNDGPAAYWFLGFASRRTVDSFWFCREGDDLCPLDANQRLNWDRIVGHPIFTRIPGNSDFSPFWQMWKVIVPAEYEADAVKTADTLHALQTDGFLTVEPLVIDFGTLGGEYVGPKNTVLHCALVLAGTELENNGGELRDGTGPSLYLERTFGWFNGYRVEFIDFSPSDGVFAEADDSENRPLMRFANIYIQWRHCDGVMDAPICSLPGYAYADRRPVSERGLGEDVTDDSDTSDSNNTMGSLPCARLRDAELLYSPLWKVFQVFVESETLSLIDTNGDQLSSDVMSADDIFGLVDLGVLAEPMAMTEDETGNPVPGNDGSIFFNCPNPVPAAYLPAPCDAN